MQWIPGQDSLLIFDKASSGTPVAGFALQSGRSGFRPYVKYIMIIEDVLDGRARCSPASAGGTLRQFVAYRHLELAYRHLELNWNELRKGREY